MYYATSRAYDEEVAKGVIQEIENYPLEIVEADQNLTLEAAKLKARYSIAYKEQTQDSSFGLPHPVLGGHVAGRWDPPRGSWN